MANVDADRNLIFGILAFQMDFLTRDALIAGLNAWVLKKSSPLGRVLVEQGSLAEDERALIEALVSKHLEKHRGDPEESLSAVSRTRAAPDGLAASVVDPELRASLSRITPGTFEDPERTCSFAAPPSNENGDPTARFWIRRPHAEGGLGRVYLATDRELNRLVALKQIKEDRADFQADRERFVFEAQVTGGLEHPGIVPVYAMGRDADGRPYYAMRFIQGEALKTAIHRLHVDAEGGPMGLRGLIGRLIDVCNAVAYAHSRGVIHRDIKPSNIMLGRYGETLLVDWGLAKAIDRPETAATAYDEEELRPSWSGGSGTLPGYPMGTPRYMSPEQAMGRLGTVGIASDIFGLGATLHCILTGRPPLDSPPPDAKADVASVSGSRDAELDRPEVPRPLAAVARKAMAKRPEDRYPSALEMAADLERWLADEPVSAHREPISTRAGRWIRRHRTSVAAAGALLLASVVGLAINNSIVRTERDAARLAERTAKLARAREARARAEAEANLLLARRAADQMLRRIAEEKLPNIPELAVLRKDLAHEALEFAHAFLRQSPDDPSVRRETALTLRQVANIEQITGDLAAALKHFDEAEVLYRGLILDDPDDPIHADLLAQFLVDISGALREAGQTREAATRLERAQAIADEQYKAHPESPSGRRTLAFVLSAYSQHLAREGRDTDALSRADEAVRLFEGLQTIKEGGSPIDPLLLLMAMVERLPLQREAGRWTEATDALDRSIALAQSIVDRETIGTDARYYLAVALRERAWILAENQPAEAGLMLDKSVQILDGLLKAAPTVRFYPPALAESRSVRAVVRAAIDRFDEAEADLKAAEKGLAAIVTNNPNDIETQMLRHRILARRAEVARRRGDRAGAASTIDRAIADADALARQHPENARPRREADHLRTDRNRILGDAKGEGGIR